MIQGGCVSEVCNAVPTRLICFHDLKCHLFRGDKETKADSPHNHKKIFRKFSCLYKSFILNPLPPIPSGEEAGIVRKSGGGGLLLTASEYQIQSNTIISMFVFEIVL
jgi:hypothetical protein